MRKMIDFAIARMYLKMAKTCENLGWFFLAVDANKICTFFVKGADWFIDRGEKLMEKYLTPEEIKEIQDELP